MNNKKINKVVIGAAVINNSIADHYTKNNPPKKIVVLEGTEF